MKRGVDFAVREFELECEVTIAIVEPRRVHLVMVP